MLGDANREKPSVTYRPGTVTLEFLRQLAQLSWLEEGPRLAKEFLGKHGIPLVTVAHLPKTYLDGAALKLGDGTPVIGLTLRYDRLVSRPSDSWHKSRSGAPGSQGARSENIGHI